MIPILIPFHHPTTPPVKLTPIAHTPTFINIPSSPPRLGGNAPDLADVVDYSGSGEEAAVDGFVDVLRGVGNVGGKGKR